ncbi:MAG: signal peptidase I [Clostridia bacterium]|nr:signal peptidase I [Clostridia bacterium]
MDETKKTPEKKKKRRAVEIIGYIVIFAIAALLIFVIAMRATNRTVFVFDRTTLWVITPSMDPEIPAKSYILIRKATAADVKVGDVIAFRSDDPMLAGSLNTHRVIAVIGDNEEFVTKGDNNANADKYTAKAANVVGIYVKTLPTMTALGRFLFSGIGIVITVTIVLGTVMIMYVPEISRGTRRRTEELEKKRKELIDERVREEVERLMAEQAAKQAAEPASEPTPEQPSEPASQQPPEQPSEPTPERQEESADALPEPGASEEDDQ